MCYVEQPTTKYPTETDNWVFGIDISSVETQKMITLSPYTKTPNSECGNLVYKASTDTDSTKDLFKAYGAVIDNNIITLKNVQAIPKGQYTVTVTVSLSTASKGDVFYSTTIRVNVVDCLNSSITISGKLDFPSTSPYEVRFGNSASFAV